MATQNEAQSELFSIKWKEIGRGFVTAVFGGLITWIYSALQAGNSLFNIDWKTAGGVALAAGLGYVIQKFFRNQDDQFLIPK